MLGLNSLEDADDHLEEYQWGARRFLKVLDLFLMNGSFSV